MVLPTFRSLAAKRRQENEERERTADRGVVNGEAGESDRTLTPTYTPGINLKRATRARKTWIAISSFFFLISVVFLILVSISVPLQMDHKLISILDNNRKYQHQSCHPLDLYLQTRPCKHNPRLRSRRHNVHQLPRPLSRPT